MDKYFLKSLSCTFDSRLLYEITVQISTSKWCQWIEIYVYHVSVTNSISMCIFRHYKWSGNVSFCFLDFLSVEPESLLTFFVILFSLRGFENAQVQSLTINIYFLCLLTILNILNMWWISVTIYTSTGHVYNQCCTDSMQF